MNEREQQRKVRHRLAVIRHAAEVTGNVAATCRYYGISRPTFYKWLNRFDEAQPILERDPESPSEPLHTLRFELAFMRGDAAAMRREVDWTARTANQHAAAIWQVFARRGMGSGSYARTMRRRSSARVTSPPPSLPLRRQILCYFPTLAHGSPGSCQWKSPLR